MAIISRHVDKAFNMDQELRRMLESSSPRIRHLIRIGMPKKKEEAAALFEHLPVTPEVMAILRRWIALDMILKDSVLQADRDAVRAGYDAEFDKIIESLREQASRKARMESLIQTAPDVLPSDVANKCRFVSGLFGHEGAGTQKLYDAARKLVKLEGLLHGGRITEEEYDGMQDSIFHELRAALSKSDQQAGITPSSSSVSYARTSSGPLADQRRTT